MVWCTIRRRHLKQHSAICDHWVADILSKTPWNTIFTLSCFRKQLSTSNTATWASKWSHSLFFFLFFCFGLHQLVRKMSRVFLGYKGILHWIIIYYFSSGKLRYKASGEDFWKDSSLDQLPFLCTLSTGCQKTSRTRQGVAHKWHILHLRKATPTLTKYGSQFLPVKC